MRACARQRGYNLNHTAQQFVVDDYDHQDYILTMDDENYHDVLSLARDKKDREKVHRFCDYCTKTGAKEVPDPYYSGRCDVTLDVVEDGCNGFFNTLLSSA